MSRHTSDQQVNSTGPRGLMPSLCCRVRQGCMYCTYLMGSMATSSELSCPGWTERSDPTVPPNGSSLSLCSSNMHRRNHQHRAYSTLGLMARLAHVEGLGEDRPSCHSSRQFSNSVELPGGGKGRPPNAVELLEEE